MEKGPPGKRGGKLSPDPPPSETHFPEEWDPSGARSACSHVDLISCNTLGREVSGASMNRDYHPAFQVGKRSLKAGGTDARPVLTRAQGRAWTLTSRLSRSAWTRIALKQGSM